MVNGVSGNLEKVMMATKSNDIRIERPLEHRPDVLKITKPDGSSKIIGDHLPFSPSDFMELGTVIKPETGPRERDFVTTEEQGSLDQAEADVEQARELHDARQAELDAARERRAQAEARWDGRLDEAEAMARLNPLRAAERKAEAAATEARAILDEACRARGQLTNRINAAARSRMPAPEVTGPQTSPRVDAGNWRDRLRAAAGGTP